MNAAEKCREVAQFARGMSCTAQSSMDSNCQSIWLARKQDVFNPGCCWLQCCWFHQICIKLSIQSPSLQHRSMKSHCSLAPLLWMELFVRKSLDSGFNLCRLSIVRGNVELYPTYRTVKLERGASTSELADGCAMGGFSLSLWLPLAFISLKERGENVHWSWPVVSLVLAGDGRGGDVKVAAAINRRFEERTSGFFRSKCVRQRSTLI